MKLESCTPGAAIRYGETEDVKARLTTVVEHALDKQHLQELLEDYMLAPDIMDASRVQRIRADMERADARRLQPRYERITFDKALVAPRVLFYLEHAIQDASLTRSGERRVVSKRMLYIEIDADGSARPMHYAPYLDFRPLRPGEPDVAALLSRPECAWIDRDIERLATGHAVTKVVPEHLKEVGDVRLPPLAKTEAAVKARLTNEITYWDHRAEHPLASESQAGERQHG